MQTVRKNAEDFVEEAYNSGINYELYTSFRKSSAILGYDVEFSIVGKNTAKNHQEIITFIETTPLVIKKDEFFTCRLKSRDTVLRIGGRS